LLPGYDLGRIPATAKAAASEVMLCSQSSYALGVMAGSLLANVHILTKLFEILAGHKGIKKN